MQNKDSNNKSINNIIKCQNYSKHGDLNEFIAKYKGSKWREYRELFTKVNNLEEFIDYPLYVVIESFFNCNLKCVMCGMGDENFLDEFKHGKTLSIDNIKRIIDELSELGTPSIAFNAYNEPLLKKKLLLESIKYANEKGITDVFFTTNATELDEKTAIEILDAEPTQIRISFDSFTEDSYKKIRLGADFNKVKENILRFLELKEERKQVFPIVRMSFVNMSLNNSEIEDFIAYWKEKVDYVSIQRFMPCDDSEEQLSLRVDNIEEQDEIITQNEQFTCAYPFYNMYIRGNGDVMCCCKLEASTKIGNINEMSISDAFNSKTNKLIRKSLLEKDFSNNKKCFDCLSNAKLL